MSRVNGTVREREAEGYLQSQGLNVIARNFRLRCGEVDLIAEEGGVLAFVEVRFRENEVGFQDGLESVDARKRARIMRVARAFLVRYSGGATGIRFDVVHWLGGRLVHVRDAWYP